MADWIQINELVPTSVRALLGFVIAWALLKTGKKRFLKRGSAFDALLALMTGAVLGRGIVEGESFFSSLAAATVIMLAHWAFAWVAYHVPSLSRMIEGHARILIHDGAPDRHQMARALVSEADLQEELRLRTGSSDLSAVDAAWQERSGKISLRLKSNRDAG